MKIAVFLFSLIVFSSCNFQKNKKLVKADKLETEQFREHPGKKLMETNCYICHSPTTTEDNRIGPPMIAIKKHYINSETSKEAFITAMQAWIKNPNAKDAKMFGAVKRFGVMPKQAYPEKTIAKIAEYMYENEIEQPEWFGNHFNNQKGKNNGKAMRQGLKKVNPSQNKSPNTNFDTLPYGERGLKYALATKAVLGKNLMETIQKKGTLEALSFCNERAYPLTDSMSVVHNAIIKRVSDKPRNPNNKANLDEFEYIKTFKTVVANNEEANPMVKELSDEVKVFYPIITNTMCIQCHGKPGETLNKSTLTKIKKLYPTDKAIGYGVNEVRGIWSITYNK